MSDNMQDKTTPITPELDVQERLRQLRAWRKDWQQEDAKMLTMIDNLDPMDPLEAQKGVQIKTVRTYNRLLLVQSPFEINKEQVVKYQYKVLADNLKQQFARLSRDSRIDWLQNLMFFMLPMLRVLYDKIARIRGYSSAGQQRNFLLGGPSGMGKTSCIDWMLFNNNPTVEEHYNRIPIVKIDAPVENTSAKPMLQQMILRCGKSYQTRQTVSSLHNMVMLLFQQCRVQVVIVDEIQHLKTHRMKRHLLEISNENRGIPMICASCNPIEFTQGDAEIQGRWNDYFALEPYRGKDFYQLLGFIELLLPFTEASGLGVARYPDGAEGPATFIEKVTGGITRDVMILLADASRMALERGDPSISYDVLAQSWSNIQQQSIKDITETLELKRK